MYSTTTKPLMAYLIVNIECCIRIPVEARYDARDPYAVRIDFGPNDEALNLDEAFNSWTFGRELLATGLERPSGYGDVHIWPCGPEMIMVELRSDNGSAVVAVLTDDVRDFLEASYRVVLPGFEGAHLEWDRELSHLLEGA